MITMWSVSQQEKLAWMLGRYFVIYLLQFRGSKEYTTSKTLRRAVHNVDYKFIAIPLVFIILRMWTCIQGIVIVYVNMKTIPHWLASVLLYLSVGVIKYLCMRLILTLIYSYACTVATHAHTHTHTHKHSY